MKNTLTPARIEPANRGPPYIFLAPLNVLQRTRYITQDVRKVIFRYSCVKWLLLSLDLINVICHRTAVTLSSIVCHENPFRDSCVLASWHRDIRS